MSRFLKYRKLFILIMVALAIITAATAFSVSYAKWTSSGTHISSDGKTGTWEELTNPIYKIQFTGQTEEEATDFGRNEYSGIYSTYFTVRLSESNKCFNILGETKGFTDIINDYTNNDQTTADYGKTKHCIVAGENGYKYKTNGAGTYTIAINTETKTITFSYIQATATSYIHVINFNDKSSVAFMKDTSATNRYSITFAIDGDKSFNIIQNGDPIDLEKTELGLGDCVIETGASNGFAFKTSKGAGIYTVVIVLTLDGDSKLTKSNITFTYEELTSTDNNLAFKDAVNNPSKMLAKIGSYYGIITSKMEVIPFDTDAKESNYFTLEEGNVFAILINNIRINNANYGALSIPVDGIQPDPGGFSGSTTHLYQATKTGTFYITYESTSPSGIVIKAIDRIGFKDAIGTVTANDKSIAVNSATLTRSADDSYTTEFTINDITKSDFNVYLSDAIPENLTVAADSTDYIEASTTEGYAFAFKAAGSYKVTVANGEISVTSSAETTASVTVNGANKVRINQTSQLIATAKNTAGKELPMTGKAVTWAVSDTAAATIDENGVLTGKTVGTVTVTATVDGVTSAEFTVQVLEKEKVRSVAISGDKTVAIGGSVSLKAIVKGEDGTTLTDRSVTWASSDKNIATVDGNGKLKGVKLGTVTITATVEGKSAIVTITVIDAVSSVTISGANTVEVEGTIQLTATVKGASGDILTDRTVNWKISKNGSNATIDQNGVLTGVKAGKVTVTATVDGKSSTLEVTVTAKAAEKETLSSVSINGAETIAEGMGNSVTLTAKAVGSNNSDLTSASTVTWSVDKAELASVTDGKLTLTASAKADDIITVTVSVEYDGVTKTATHTVTVKKASQKVIMYFDSSANPVVEAYVDGSWKENADLVDNASTANGQKNVSTYSINLSYDNGTPDKAEDDKTGLKTALKYESATTLSFKLKQKSAVTIYYLYKTSGTSVAEATLKDNTANQSLLLPDVAAERGYLKSAVFTLESGEYTFARSGGEVEICYIIFEAESSGTVEPTPEKDKITGVSINGETTVAVGGTLTLTATVTAEDASGNPVEGKKVTWSVEGNATIDNDGKLTLNGDAAAGDTITVTAISVDDTTKSATHTVTVVAKQGGETSGATQNYANSSIKIGDTFAKDSDIVASGELFTVKAASALTAVAANRALTCAENGDMNIAKTDGVLVTDTITKNSSVDFLNITAKNKDVTITLYVSGLTSNLGKGARQCTFYSGETQVGVTKNEADTVSVITLTIKANETAIIKVTPTSNDSKIGLFAIEAVEAVEE